ncbi:MAG: ComEC/Rec2 family competence protein [Clostridium sp.]|nr:ComEC/Rec2 family competence protein [Clostridium sp.]
MIVFAFRLISPDYSAKRHGLLCLAVAIFFAAHSAVVSFSPEPDIYDAERDYSGVVSELRQTVSGWRIVADLTSDSPGDDLPVRSVVWLRFHYPEPSVGDSLRVRCALRPVTPSKTVDDEIEASSLLYDQGIRAQKVLNDPVQISLTHNEPSVAGKFFGRMRSRMLDLLSSGSLSEQSEMLLGAFLAGSRDLIDDETGSVFSSAGISHMLAISGAHVGIVALLLNWLLFPLLFWHLRIVRAAVVLVAVWLFVGIVGMPASAVRAAVMLSVFTGASLSGRRNSSGNSLLFSAMLILACSPGQLFDAGFLLSFAAVGSILLFSGWFGEQVSGRHPFVVFLLSSLFVSVAAMIGTGLISAFLFNRFPVWFLVGNLAVGMLLPWFIAAGLLFILTGGAAWIAEILNFLADSICTGATTVAMLPGAVVEGLYFPSWVFGPYVAAVVALWCLLRTRRARRFWAGACALMAAVIFAGVWADSPSREPEWFVGCHSGAELFVNDGDTLRVWSSSGMLANDAVEKYRSRFDRYMSRRKLAGPVGLAPDDSRMLEGDRKRGLFVVGEDTIFILDRRTRLSDLPFGRVDYLIVSSEMRNRPTGFYGAIHADTVIDFSGTWPSGPIPVHDLRAAPFRRPLRQPKGR